MTNGLAEGDSDTVLGHAYSGAFRSRPVYRHTRETSVYLAPEAMGSGLGTRLSKFGAYLSTTYFQLRLPTPADVTP